MRPMFIEPRTLVRHKEHERGVAVDASRWPVSFSGVAVYWEGEIGGKANCFYETDALEVIGRETPLADLEKCGCGRGENACVFLTVAPSPTCQRFLSLHNELIESAKTRQDGAQRVPTEFFPKCQL